MYLDRFLFNVSIVKNPKNNHFLGVKPVTCKPESNLLCCSPCFVTSVTGLLNLRLADKTSCLYNIAIFAIH